MNSRPHHRASNRLRGYDYTRAGAYFITICTHRGERLFGEVVGGAMQLNAAGSIVARTWIELPIHYSHILLDAVVVMPDHMHGIVVITHGADPDVGAGLKPAPTTAIGVHRHGLSEIVRAIKTFSARRINLHRGTPGVPVWQRNYYDHVISNDGSLTRIREYIRDNPSRWMSDRENLRNDDVQFDVL
ncbi:MAG: transposase [Gemmatimonadota bacterium]|jgi:REP element-mobilizing transposase RayT|nr:transposase [Gemmatimonadota bacterium]